MPEIIAQPEQAPASGGKPKQLVILLHGVGSNGQDLFSLVPEFAALLPDAHFISPDAPFPCDMAPMGYQWFSLMDRDMQTMLSGLNTVEPLLNDFMDAQLERFDLSPDKLALIGFSQGTMTSLHVSLRRKEPIAGILGYSGALLAMPESPTKFPICLVHGTQDPVVPFAAMEQASVALQADGVEVETHAREGLPHGIDPEGVEIGKRFLQRIFS